MHIKKEFRLRQVDEEYVVVPVGQAAQKFTGMIRLNSTAALLWETLQDGNATEASLVECLIEEFEGEEGFTPELAKADVRAFLENLRANHLLEEDA